MAIGLERRRVIALLDADPDLAAGVEQSEIAAARRAAIAPLLELQPPSWDPGQLRSLATDDWLGVFVVDGVLIRRVRVVGRAGCELFGGGDMVRPWDADDVYDPLPVEVDWLVLRPARLAILDGAFARRVARWPSISARIAGRLAHRARYLSLTQAVTHIPRAHVRLLLLFWLFAERWGRMGRDGVRVTLPLTHEVLAMLAGAHRPTITIALQRLSRAGLLIRERSDCWLLTRLALERLAEPDVLHLDDDELAESASLGLG